MTGWQRVAVLFALPFFAPVAVALVLYVVAEELLPGTTPIGDWCYRWVALWTS